MTASEREALEWEIARVLYKAILAGYYRPNDLDKLSTVFAIRKGVKYKLLEIRTKEAIENGMDRQVP